MKAQLSTSRAFATALAAFALIGFTTGAAESDLDGKKYVAAARKFADTVLEHGRDNYGKLHTPLFVDGLQADTLEPARWKKKGETWVLCNFASQQSLLRTLDGLTAITKEARYRQAAEDATGYALKHLRLAQQLAQAIDLGDIGESSANKRAFRFDTSAADWRFIYSLLELARATGDRSFLKLAGRVGDNLLAQQAKTGLFPRLGRAFAQTGDEVPLAILHLAAALDRKESLVPQAMLDRAYFHCEYDGALVAKKPGIEENRSYDSTVFYRE